MMEKLLTPEQVAESLQISKITVMTYLRTGKIKGIKVGRLWRIHESDLRNFLRNAYQIESNGGHHV
jgi:excisionase family DNA binding protein